MMRGKHLASPHRFVAKLNSVESALKYPHNLIADHASSVEFDYDANEIRLRVYEDVGSQVSAFLIEMSQANHTLVSQQYRMTFTTMAAQGLTEVATIIFDGVIMTSHRLYGFHYRGDDPVEHEIGLRFSTVIIGADAIRPSLP